MRLPDFLADRGLTRAGFAALVGVHPVTVSKWCTGTMRPDWQAMEAIKAATSGAVTPNDFLSQTEAG